MIYDTDTLSTHRGPVAPYGDKGLDRHLFRYLLVAWRHQAISCTNVDLFTSEVLWHSYERFHKKMFRVSIFDISLKIDNLA